MTCAIGDADWCRTWTDGRSSLTVEHDVDGGVRMSVDDVERPGFAAKFGRIATAEITAFMRGEA